MGEPRQRPKPACRQPQHGRPGDSGLHALQGEVIPDTFLRPRPIAEVARPAARRHPGSCSRTLRPSNRNPASSERHPPRSDILSRSTIGGIGPESCHQHPYLAHRRPATASIRNPIPGLVGREKVILAHGPLGRIELHLARRLLDNFTPYHHLDAQRTGDSVVESTPGMNSIHGKFGGEQLLSFG